MKLQVSGFRFQEQVKSVENEIPGIKTQVRGEIQKLKSWIPAYTGMTGWGKVKGGRKD